jgi:hypothetical protein
MRILFSTLFILYNIFPALTTAQELHTYNIIILNNIIINKKKIKVATINYYSIKQLNEPLKALAAYYSSIAGSNCNLDESNEEICDLTSALGLGKQGSEIHQAILKKWFKTKDIETQLNQNCYLNISGSNYFSNYSYLLFNVKGDTINVEYKISHYERGHSYGEKNIDIAIIKNNKIIFIKK